MDSKPRVACCGSAPFVPTPRPTPAREDEIVKTRWTVTLPNGSVKRFQSSAAAESYADMYDGAIEDPAPDPDEAAGEPVQTVKETSRQRKNREAREAAEAAERAADGTGGPSTE